MYLRKLKEKDAEGMLEWMHDPEIQKNFHVPMADKKREDALRFIREAETVPVDGRSIHFAIADEDDEYLGTISLKNLDLEARNGEYAICLRKKAQGRRIGMRATKELLDLAFNKFQMERVYLNVLAENEKAIRLYLRCGFVYEGTFRKHLFLQGENKTLQWYGMLREEYLKLYGRIV